jgi:ribosome-associated toxin RatA of RatAB toxin-antitoxin module
MTLEKKSASSRISLKKSLSLLGGLVLLLACPVGYAYVLGTWAEREVRYPSSSEEIVVQLYQDNAGSKKIRGAILVPCSLHQVWKTLTDYAHFPQFFKNLKSLQVTPLEGEKVRLEGVAKTWIGDYTFHSTVSHEVESSAGNARIFWDEGEGDTLVKRNKGSWELIAKEEDQTLVIYELELEVKKVPQFLIYDFLLFQLSPTLSTLKALFIQNKE